MKSILVFGIWMIFCEKSFAKESSFDKLNKCELEHHSKLFGRTSDRELFDSKVDIITVKTPIDFDKSDFYDPTYGFSKESLAGLGVFDGKDKAYSPTAIGIDHLPLKTFQQNSYSKPIRYENDYSLNTPPPLSFNNPLNYLNHEKNPVDSSQSSSHDSIIKTDVIDYEQYFKKLNEFVQRGAYGDNLGGFKPSKINLEADNPRYVWQTGVDNKPKRQYYDFSKLYSDPDYRKYATELLGKLVNSADYEIGSETDEILKSKDRKPIRNRRPNLRNKPRSANCNNPHCRNRRPGFVPF